MLATSTPEMKRLRKEADKKKSKGILQPKKCVTKLFEMEDDSDSGISISALFESDHEDDWNQIEHQELVLGNVETLNVEDYVLCEFTTKTSRFYYVGKVSKGKRHRG